MAVNETNTRNLERLMRAGMATEEDLTLLNMASIDGDMNLETADVQNLPHFQGTTAEVLENAGRYIQVRDQYIESKRKWPGNLEQACNTATLFQSTDSLVDLLTSCNNKADLLEIAEDKNRDERIRTASIGALADLGATEYTDELLGLFGTTENDTFHSIDNSIVRFLGKTRATEHADFLLGIVKSSTMYLTSNAIKALVDIGNYKQIAELIESDKIVYLGKTNYLKEAAQIIIDNKATYFKPSLKNATTNFFNKLSARDWKELHEGKGWFLDDAYPKFKLLMNAIASISDDSDITYFTNLIETRNLGDHGNAAVLNAIATIGTRKALDKVWLLVYKLKGSRANVQTAIAESVINAFTKHGNAEKDKWRFARLIIEDHTKIESEGLNTAIDTLKKWGAAEELWELALALRHSHHSGEYAFRALAGLNMPRLTDRVRKEIATQLLNDGFVSWEIWLLGKIGGEKEADFLRTELFLMKDYNNKTEAITALKNLGRKEDLLIAATSPNLGLYYNNLAIEALKQLEATAELKQITDNTELPELFRLTAAEAL